jgi:hypothetical protein
MKLDRFQRAVLVTSLYPPRDARPYRPRLKRRRTDASVRLVRIVGGVFYRRLVWDAGTRHGFRRRALILASCEVTGCAEPRRTW